MVFFKMSGRHFYHQGKTVISSVELYLQVKRYKVRSFPCCKQTEVVVKGFR